MIKKLSMCLLVIACLWQPVQAGSLEDYREARKLYVFAAACRAAYDDRLGYIAQHALEDAGWQIQKYKQVGNKADARLMLVKHPNFDGSGQAVYLLAATGTENAKDVLTDLTVDKVGFFGHTLDEIVANAEKKPVPPQSPMIHRGFFNYVKTAFSIVDEKAPVGNSGLLADVLREHPERKMYLVGHSLGGAAVTVGAAALVNCGVRPEQLEVVTFGAPAVGNATFRDTFADKLSVTRYVNRGDMVTGVLQGLSNYVQMGQEVTWTVPDNFAYNSHEMVVYLDKALKNYYDKRQIAINEGTLKPARQVLPASPRDPSVYILPPANRLPDALRGEYVYMKEGLYGEYRDLFPAYQIAADDAVLERQAALQQAAAAGCQWLVVPELQANKLKNDKNAYQIILQQAVYRVKDGSLVSLAAYSSNTMQLTPAEAALHNSIELSEQPLDWLKKP